jgi:Na+/H+ antiporter NhaD/arsenite permease-like protein
VTLDQIIALIVLVAVVGVMIHGRMRSDVVALSGAAALLLFGVVRPVEVQSAFASPAVIALAGLLVIAYAIELSGLLGLMIRKATGLCRRFGATGIWVVIGLCGSVGGFLNNTPVVVLAAPVVRDMARSLKLSPKRFLMPLSHVTVMGGLLTLIGTSTNLLVNDMARNAGQPVFSLFEITPVGLVIALVGGLWLYFVGARQLGRAACAVEEGEAERERLEADAQAARTSRRWRLPFSLPSLAQLGESRSQRDGTGDAHLGDVDLYASADRPLQWKRALIALAVFVLVVAAAGLGIAPIAAAAFAGAVALILLGVLTPEEA